MRALPDAASKIDVNTLAEQGRRAGGQPCSRENSRDDAVRLLDARPESGWENMKRSASAGAGLPRS